MPDRRSTPAWRRGCRAAGGAEVKERDAQRDLRLLVIATIVTLVVVIMVLLVIRVFGLR